MAGWYVRGRRGLGLYLSKGYNLVDRCVVGEEKDDSRDLFTWLGSTTSKKVAQRRLLSIQKSGKHKGVEIIEFKLSDQDTE